MEKMLLSLKNIYKILVTNDFPIYSESVISEKNRKGQTLLRFWQAQLADEFRCLPVGQMIWRNDGKRNRFLSNLCNRSLEQKLCAEYAGELAQQITASALLNQIERFMTFLSAKAYRHDVLLRRISELLRLCGIDDNRVSEQLVQHLLKDVTECADMNGLDNLFQAGYLLTVLTIYAAAGNAMDDSRLSVLSDKSYSVYSLWVQARMKEPVHADAVSFLSVHAGILQDNPLPPHRFFGREEELYDLQEMVTTNRKCLISGMGGVGKTELLRQLLRLCSEEKLADKIVVIPYELGIVESFLRAFPNHQQNAEEAFHSILHMLEKQTEDGFRLLVLVDNMNNSLEEDPALDKLLQLPCSVLITSRRKELPGFGTYYIREPLISTGSLIFRDNFGKPLSTEDRVALHALLKDPAICHPLTLRMMARASVGNGWSVPRLAEQLREDISGLTWTEEDQSLRLDRIYRQLYSQTMLSNRCREVADLFTLLPRGSYSRDFLEQYFPYLADDLKNKLDTLEAGGWLETDTDGYSMHPLIAQCLRRKMITEDRVARQIQTIRRYLTETVLGDRSIMHGKDTIRISEILVHIAEMLTGSISRELMLNIFNALELRVFTRESAGRYKKQLDQLMKRCHEQDDLVEVIYYTLLCRWECGDAAQILDVYHRQKRTLTVPLLRYLDLCLYAGGSLLFHQDSEMANEMCKEVIRDEATPVQIATAYYHLAVHYDITGDAEQALHWGEAGVSYVSRHPECGEKLIFNNMAALASYYVKFGRKEAAEQLIRKIDAESLTLPVQKIEYGELLGNYELYFGSLEKALTSFEEQTSLHLEYYGKDRNYYAHQGQIAIILMRLKRYEDAESRFQMVIGYAKDAGEDFLFSISCNNLAVMYLDMERPGDALPLLQETLPEAQGKGGIALGECLKNYARAYGQLGNFTQECICLRKAVPLLEGAYGPDHPRPQAARQRLQELEEIYGQTAADE